MKITFLRSMLMAAVLVGGLSLTSCKEKTTTETETETTMDGDTATTITETEIDAPGEAHDAKTTDTVTKVQ